MALGLSVAGDLANALLDLHMRGPTLDQTTQDKPLLRILSATQKTFPGGKQYITTPVQGAYMSDTAGFFQGMSEDDELTFAQAANVLRAQYEWKEHHSGLIITWTELKKDGISIIRDGQVRQHSKREMFVLTDVLQNRLDDFSESWSRSKNHALWMDGSQAAKTVAGLTSLILSTNEATATTGGLSRATYSWWRNRKSLGLAVSEENQSLTKFMRREVRQLRRYGVSKPNVALCGEEFLNALEVEVQKKGEYTTTGFARTQDISQGDIRIGNLMFEWDPWLDDHGQGKYCYILDSRRVRLRPMEGEENKQLDPERPYNYLVFIRSMVTTLAMEASQLNGCGVYSVA
jgi:hypothetical protein